MEARTCAVCNEEFIPNSWSHRLCSEPCRARHNYKQAPPRDDLPHPTLGSIAELIVAADLMKSGWHMFRALALHAFCDLIAVKDGETRYLEVRTARENVGGSLSFPKRLGSGATEFALYIRATGEVRYRRVIEATPARKNGLTAVRIDAG